MRTPALSSLQTSSPRLAFVAALATSACFPPDDGRSPPLDRLYFPVGLAVDPGRTRLYVANSDFDLQYNAGTLQALDLTKLRRIIPRHCTADEHCAERGQVCDVEAGERAASYWCVDPGAREPCGELGEKSAAARLLSPGRCNAVNPENPPGGVGSLLVDRVAIGAFATDVVYQARPADRPGAPGRLFLPVRGDGTLHWVDVTPGTPGAELDCGQDGDSLCDQNHRRGDDPAAENTRAVSLPPEPFGVAVDERGEALLMTHQTEGSVALFVNEWGESQAASDGPRLQHVLPGLPSGALGVAAVPRPQSVVEDPSLPYQQSFLVTFRTSPVVHVVRYLDDSGANPGRPYAEASLRSFISTNSDGYNSRGIAIDPSRRQACEADCAGEADADRQSCLQRCSALGLDVYVANRAPATLIVGESRASADHVACLASGSCTAPPSDVPRFIDAVGLSFGASRVVMGNVRDVDGSKVPRVFVMCFDSKQVFIYDPKGYRVEAVIRTGRGPHAMAIDDGALEVGDEAYGYVAHFTDSYIGVVDLNRGHPTYGRMILTLGEPSPPRASK